MSQDSSEKPPASPSPATTLAQIAELLDCPAEVFTNGANEPAELRDVSELLQLWQAIPRAADRERILALARHLADA